MSKIMTIEFSEENFSNLVKFMDEMVEVTETFKGMVGAAMLKEKLSYSFIVNAIVSYYFDEEKRERIAENARTYSYLFEKPKGKNETDI